MSTSNDAEVLAISLAIEARLADPINSMNNIAICADSRFAIHRARQLSLGHPPQSGIESRLKQAMAASIHQDINIYLTWVRAHIAIAGNEEADRAANRASWDGDIRHLPMTATPSGVVAASKHNRSQWRSEKSFGKARSTYSYRALSAYTWVRTDRGPQRSWL